MQFRKLTYLSMLAAALTASGCGESTIKPIVTANTEEEVEKPFCELNPTDAKCVEQKEFCDENPNDPDCKVFEETNIITVTGNLTGAVSWAADKKYILGGKVSVVDGAVLTIAPGTLVVGNRSPLGWLQVQQGGKVVANGTAAKPIVFTSSKDAGLRESGDWGGIIINGKAPINVAGGTAEGEGGAGTYGGTDAADNSGSLKYVRIEFAGWELSPDNELNSLTLNGVGSGTTLEYIQVHYGLDDGFEFFGGTVNGKYLLASGTDDDCFDWTQGYTGKLQFITCMHADNRGDRGIEADGNEQDHTATPHSAPTIYNATLIGRGGSTYDPASDSRGITLRRGTEAYIYNAIIMNFWKNALDIDDAATVTGTIAITNSLAFGNGAPARATTAQFDTDADTIDEVAKFTGEATNNYDVNPSFMSIVFATPDLRPSAGSGALTGGATPPSDGFFDTSATYRGAFGATTNWLTGWTKMNAN